MSEFHWNDKKVIADVKQIVKDVLTKEGVQGVAQIRRRFSSKGPSRPGRPPAIVTGTLSRSVYAIVEPNMLTFTVRASQMQKAMALELGAPSINLYPRPFMQPQLPLSVKRINRNLLKRLRKYGFS